jgi:hypothetical protein
LVWFQFTDISCIIIETVVDATEIFNYLFGMARLKNRQMQIPNGLQYYQPQTGWKSSPYSSFDAICRGVEANRKGNPYICRRDGLSTDYNTICDEVEAFNVAICVRMGYTDYITGDPSPPISRPAANSFSRSVRLAAGAKTLVDWLKSGADAVEAPLANSRAVICSSCPQNKQGDFTSFFTIPVSEAIRSALENRKSMNLSTPSDGSINVCDACGCPLKLKVHLPIADIAKRMPPESRAALDPGCWILAESKV